MTYLEKLARLDFLAARQAPGPAAASPVEHALRELLALIRREHAPDFILLDCRAGISDLGGLSLNDLPHVDVLVGRAGRPWEEGLELILRVLARRRAEQDRRVVLAHTFVPLPVDSAPSLSIQATYRARAYEVFSSWIWKDDAPAEEDTDAPHYPVAIGRYDELSAAASIGQLSETVLDNEPFRELRRRIEAAAEPEEPDEGPPGEDQ